MDFRVSHTIKWGGAVWYSDIKKAAKIGVKEAISIYFWTLRGILSRGWGSIQYRGNARKTIKHSQPGEPPLIQTENLVNSLNVLTGNRAARMYFTNVWDNKSGSSAMFMNEEQHVACVYTDVPYAKELEYGGLAGPYKAHLLKYTYWRLINPIRHTINIAPRPAWRPAYSLSVSRMISVIRVRMSTMTKRTYIR